jgi:hypothetical protein
MLEEIIDLYPEIDFLKADGFDEAIIGVDEKDFRIIYSVKKCIDVLIENGMEESDAIEYFDFNISGAYVGEKTPIWCYDIF